MHKGPSHGCSSNARAGIQSPSSAYGWYIDFSHLLGPISARSKMRWVIRACVFMKIVCACILYACVCTCLCVLVHLCTCRHAFVCFLPAAARVDGFSVCACGGGQEACWEWHHPHLQRGRSRSSVGSGSSASPWSPVCASCRVAGRS